MRPDLRRLLPALIFILGTTHPWLSIAQEHINLDRLVFDPVLIEDATGHEIRRPEAPLRFVASGSVPGEATAEMQASPEPGFSPLEVSRNIERYQQSLSRAEEETGPFSTSLVQILMDLGSQYQLMNDHESAIEVFQRAEYISRINNGLYHPDQFESIRKLIESYMATGDVASANEKQRYLVFLSEEHYGALAAESTPSLVNLADHHMDNFYQVIGSPAVPTLSISSNAGPRNFNRPQLTPRQMAFGSLFMAQISYQRAITAMINNKQFFDPTILDLESRLLETLLLQSFRTSIIEDPDYYLSERRSLTGSLIKHNINRRNSNGFIVGKSSFERILIYLKNNPEAKVYQLVNAMIEYGDWNLLFDRGYTAAKKYQEAFALMKEMNVSQESIDQIFRPAFPVHLPLITAKPNSRSKFRIPDNAPLEYLGHIDVTFTISKYGRAKGFDITARSENLSRNIERRLLRYLRNSPFRPILDSEGEFTDRQVSMRYYVAHADNYLQGGFSYSGTFRELPHRADLHTVQQ